MKIIDSQQKDIVAELKRIIDRGETATEEAAQTVKEGVERVRKEGDPAGLAVPQGQPGRPAVRADPGPAVRRHPRPAQRRVTRPPQDRRS